MLTYKIHLFRHGITRANLEGKYVGLSDYPLCQEGIDALKEFVKDKDYPPVEKIYTSPLRRCRETAHILYPGYKTFDVPQLMEMDFGTYEGKTLDELQACELLPFAADTGLHAVMVGHIAAPNVTGDGTPATLSPQLVALIPDAENTLIVTDSLAMDAITAAYTPGEAAMQALQAGCDVLLMPNSLPEAYAAVLEAVQNGTISEERLDRSVNKILLYKQQFAS